MAPLAPDPGELALQCSPHRPVGLPLDFACRLRPHRAHCSSLMHLQALPGSAVINLSDNQGMCGGVPRPLANKLSLSRNVNSFATPCLNSPVSFSLAGANFVVLKLGSQVRACWTPCFRAPKSVHWLLALKITIAPSAAPSPGVLPGCCSTCFCHWCGNVTSAQQYIVLRG